VSGEARPFLAELARDMGGSFVVLAASASPLRQTTYAADLPTEVKARWYSDYVARRHIEAVFAGGAPLRVLVLSEDADRKAGAFTNSDVGTPGAIRYLTVPGETPENEGPGNN
jgi:hypothetical protein